MAAYADRDDAGAVPQQRPPTPHLDTDDEAAMSELRPTETNNVRPACFSSTIQEVMFVLTATMATAMTAFLTGAIICITSEIGKDLNMSTAEITWITSATSLSSGAFLLFFGKFADLFGRKTLFIGSLFLFAVLALAAGFAKTAIGLDVITGVMGLMSASAVPPAVGLLGVIYDKPSKRKNAAFACFSAGNPLGFIFGTIFSGIAAGIFNWRASFYLIAIIFFLFSIMGWFAVPVDPTDKEPLNLETLKRFDVVGTILTVAGIGMFSAALSLGDTAAQGWKTAYVLALLIIGALLMIVFVLWELWFDYPLLPMIIWRDRNFTLCISILSLGMLAFSPGSFFLALYFQDVWNMSPLMVAVHLLPMAVMGIIVNIIAGLALHRVSNKLLMLVGSMAYTAAFVLVVLNREKSSYWAFCFPALTLLVIGADLEFNVANMYVMSSMPRSQQSIAGGIFQTVVKLCMTISFGVATALFNSLQRKPSLASYWDAETQPYTATFVFSATCAALSVCLVPFLTIGTQGGKEKQTAMRQTSSSEGSSVGDVQLGEKMKEASTSAQALGVE